MRIDDVEQGPQDRRLRQVVGHVGGFAGLRACDNQLGMLRRDGPTQRNELDLAAAVAFDELETEQHVPLARSHLSSG